MEVLLIIIIVMMGIGGSILWGYLYAITDELREIKRKIRLKGI
jgi:hypothetical protein